MLKISKSPLLFDIELFRDRNQVKFMKRTVQYCLLLLLLSWLGTPAHGSDAEIIVVGSETFSIQKSAPGITFYESSSGKTFVQVVDLNRGADIRFLTGDSTPFRSMGAYGGDSKKFKTESLGMGAFSNFSAELGAYSIASGAFHEETEVDSTELSYPLIVDSEIISGGGNRETTKTLRVLELWLDGADIREFKYNEGETAESLKQSRSAIVGWVADTVLDNTDKEDAYTMLGLSNRIQPGVERYGTALILVSKEIKPSAAVQTLLEFGMENLGDNAKMSEVILLDGGRTAQLISKESDSQWVEHIGRWLPQRRVPQAIGVIEASPYEDLAARGHWGYPYIALLRRDKIIGFDSYEGSHIYPDRPTQRKEMAKMVALAAAKSGALPAASPATPPFPDVPNDHPYYDYIQALKNAGLLTGDAETGLFRPNDSLNRAETAAILERVFDLRQPDGNPRRCNLEDWTERFTDVHQGSWFYGPVRALVNTWVQGQDGAARLAQGFKNVDGSYSFRPEKPVNRVEFAKMLANVYTLRTGGEVSLDCSSVGNSFEQPAIAVGAAPGRLLLDQGSTLTVVGEDPIRIAHRSAADSDGDPLTFQWSVDLGRLESTSANDQSVQYFPPSTTALTALATKSNQPTTAKLVASAIDNKGNFSRADVTLFLYPEGTEPPASSQGIQYSYDDLDRLVEVDYGDGTKVEYTYDSLGNRLSRTVTVPTGDPDLSFASAVVPTPSTPTAGQSLQVTTNLANTGTSQASSFWIYGYFSTDETLSPDDVQLVSRLEGPLDAGETRSWETSFTLPSDLPGQSGHLLLELDATGAVAESNESNNLGAALLTLLEAPPGDPPVADFTAETTTVAPGESVAFTDRSTGEPTAWQWFFEGGTPSTSTESNPVVTYTATGNYDVRLTVTNNHGGDALTRTAYVTVSDDTNPPMTRASLPGGPIMEPTPVELVCEDDLSGCAETYYTLDGTAPTTGSAVYTGAITVRDTTLRFFSVDQAGNAESAVTEVYQLDTCVPPASGDWIVTASCEFTRQVVAPADVIVEPGVVLTLAPGAILEIDLHNQKLLVRDTGGVLVKDGGTLRQTSGTLQP